MLQPRARALVVSVLVGVGLGVGCGSGDGPGDGPGDGSGADLVTRLDEMDKRLGDIEKRLDGIETSRTRSAVTSTPAKGGPGIVSAGASTSTRSVASTPDAGSSRGDSSSSAARSFDFGSVWAGPDVERVFLLRNDSEVPLDIVTVTSSCSCLVVGEHAKRVEPDAAVEIPLALNTLKLKGQIRQTAIVRTSDPDVPEITLSLTGVVKPVIEYESFVLLRVRPQDTPYERRIKITHKREGDLSLELLPHGNSRFGVELVEIVPKSEYELVIQVDPPFEIGYQRTTVVLRTDNEQIKTLTIRVNLHVPDRLDVVPNQLLVDDRSAQGATRQLTMTNYGESPVRVLSAEVDDPAARVVAAPREVGKRYAITVTFPGGHRLPAGGRTLTLKTDDAERPALEIPIRSLGSYRSAPRSAAQGGDAVASKGKPRRRPVFDLVDKPSPRFSLATIDGDELSADGYGDSAATVLNFFAPNCGFCKRQIPLVEKVRRKYEDRGVRFVSVREVMGTEFSAEATIEMLHALDTDFEIAIDEKNRLGSQFKVTGFPTLFVVDRKGTVRHVTVGAKKSLFEDLSAQLEKLIASGD